MAKAILTDKVVPKWVWPVLGRFSEYTEQEKRFVALAAQGIYQISKSVPLAEALARFDSPENGDAESPERDAEDAAAAAAPSQGKRENRVETAKRLANLAEGEVETDFRLLHGHSLVGIWGALEAMVDDLAAEWLIHIPETLESAQFANLRIPVAEFERLDRDERMKAIVNEFDRKTSASPRRGVNRFETILEAIGLSGPVSKPVRDRLYEHQQIRNAFVHRGGLADRRLVEACPRLNLTIDSPIPLGARDYAEYAGGALHYAATVANRIRAHYGARVVKVSAPRPVPKRRWAKRRRTWPRRPPR